MYEDESGLYFDFNSAMLEDFEISRTQIKVRVRDFAILGGYQGVEHYTKYSRCILTYKDVTYSKRSIAKYTDAKRQEFSKPYEIVDADFSPTNKTMYLHFLDVVSNKINAYISWEIRASEVKFEETHA